MSISENIFKEYILFQYSENYMKVNHINNIEIVKEDYNVVINDIISKKERKTIKLNWSGFRTLSNGGELEVYNATDYFNYISYIDWQRDYKINKLVNSQDSQDF